MARVGLARAGQKSADVARFLRIVDAYEKTFESQWHKRARRVIDRFADERRDADASRARFNVLWSNVETMKPFFYSATPKPVVSPRVDEDDEVAATAAEVLERALSFFIAEEGFGETLRYVRDDYLLAGRGTAWVRYVPHIEPLQVVDSIEAGGGTPDDEGDVGEPAPQPEQVAFEEVITDFVLWRDFGHTVARAWEEVDCVWRRVKMSRKALEARFGAEVGGKVPLDCSAHGEDRAREPDEDRDRAEVYELWCKSEKRAVWFTRSHADLLDDQQDPLGLPYFFPCPRPVYATLRTDSLVPIPDYVEYQDQAAELDDLTARIDALTDAIKCAGIYDKNFPALERLLQDGHDNELVPVESWAAANQQLVAVDKRFDWAGIAALVVRRSGEQRSTDMAPQAEDCRTDELELPSKHSCEVLQLDSSLHRWVPGATALWVLLHRLLPRSLQSCVLHRDPAD